MHRLFWKIFLSFWVVLILFTLAIIVAASQYLDQIKEHRDATVRYETLTRQVAEAQAVLQSDGLEGLKAWAREVDSEEMVPVLVLGADGKDLLGREVSPPALERLRRSLNPKYADEQLILKIRPVIHRPDGTEYWLTHDFQSVTLGRFLQRPRVVAIPLLVGVFIGALVCLLLARYLTAPLKQLRRATEAYAAGDLSQRVAPLLGYRRDEIVDLATAFDHMAERLSTLMLSQKQLLIDVSHELRSPLSRVEVALGLARQRAGTNSPPELDRIEREIERLNELIGQLLSLARLESDTQPPVPEPVDLGELLQTIVSDVALEAQARRCTLRLEKRVPATIQGNAQLLHSALENVVRNAVKYTTEGTAVTLTMNRDPAQAGWLEISVRDCGSGVPEEMLTRLFEPFVRVGSARDRSSGGYGLGLAIAERAVRLHGGEISARNQPGGGLTVTIRLPAPA
jgi:two-component system, OmpR family, sensor histidine kinase CpxA